MAKIINHTSRDIRLITMHVVPANGALETDNANIRSSDNWPMLNGMALAGQVALEFDPDPDPDAPDGAVLQVVAPIADPERPAPELHPMTIVDTSPRRRARGAETETEAKE